METVPAAQFKTHCLALMDRVNRTGKPIVIAKHGKPIAKLVPARRDARSIFGYMAGKVKIVGDIESPAVPPENWKVS